MSDRKRGPMKLPKELAAALARLRYTQRVVAESEGEDFSESPLDRDPTLKIEDVEKVDESLENAVPREIVGYYAAGAAGGAKWGTNGFVNITTIPKLTKKFRAKAEELEEEGEEVAYDPAEFVAFDTDGLDYYLYTVDDSSPLERIFWIQGENFADDPLPRTLVGQIDQWIQNTLEELGDDWPGDETLPWEAELEPVQPHLLGEATGDQTDGEAEGDVVSHPKFGEGRIVKEIPGGREKYEVEFEDGERRKMLGEFLKWEEE